MQNPQRLDPPKLRVAYRSMNEIRLDCLQVMQKSEALRKQSAALRAAGQARRTANVSATSTRRPPSGWESGR